MDGTIKELHTNVLIDEFMNALTLYVEAKIDYALALNNRHPGDSWCPSNQDIPGKFDELLKAVVNLMKGE